MARSIRSSSRVVRTTSTSWLAASLTSGVADSYFLAVQGDGDAEDVLRLAQFFGIVALGHGPEHLLGALGGGEVGCHLRVLSADKPHPAGAAGGKLGQLPRTRVW